MPADEWKVQFVKELADVNQNVLFIPDDNNGQFSSDKLGEILDYITTVWTIDSFSSSSTLKYCMWTL